MPTLCHNIRRLCRSDKASPARSPDRHRTGHQSRVRVLAVVVVVLVWLQDARVGAGVGTGDIVGATLVVGASTSVRKRRSQSLNCVARVVVVVRIVRPCGLGCVEATRSCRSIRRRCTSDTSMSRRGSDRNSSSSTRDFRTGSWTDPAGASTRSDSVSEPALSSARKWLETAWARTRHSFRNRRCRSHTSCRTAAVVTVAGRTEVHGA